MEKVNQEPSKNTDVKYWPIFERNNSCRIDSLVKYDASGLIVQTPKEVMLVECQWVFMERK